MPLVATPTQVLKVHKRDSLITSDTPITLRSGTSNYLESLRDVSVAGKANNNLFVYNSTTSKWEDHSIAGTANEIEVSFSSQDITIGLPDSVTIANTLTVTTIAATNLTTDNISITLLDCGEF